MTLTNQLLHCFIDCVDTDDLDAVLPLDALEVVVGDDDLLEAELRRFLHAFFDVADRPDFPAEADFADGNRR